VVTVTFTAPAPGGETAVIDVGEFTVTLVALLDPKVTAAGRTKLLPVIVTTVPPPGGPVEGDTLATVGSDT
jgi:hypothetical protein